MESFSKLLRCRSSESSSFFALEMSLSAILLSLRSISNFSANSDASFGVNESPVTPSTMYSSNPPDLEYTIAQLKNVASNGTLPKASLREATTIIEVSE